MESVIQNSIRPSLEILVRTLESILSTESIEVTLKLYKLETQKKSSTLEK
ncbi:MAG: hypothetical protein ACK5L6_03625 [Anaerorhabdus sp.]